MSLSLSLYIYIYITCDRHQGRAIGGGLGTPVVAHPKRRASLTIEGSPLLISKVFKKVLYFRKKPLTPYYRKKPLTT